MRLDWQRRAVILFAASLLILSAVLVLFAVREAEREKLLKEREVEGARQRLIERIDGRAGSLAGEAETRVLEAVRKGAKGPPAGLPLVSDVFLVDDEGQIVFLGAGPLFLLPGEERRFREIARSLENDERWKLAETAEFRTADQSRAAALYRDLAARAADPALEVLFLNRLARCCAKSGRPEDALAAYGRQLRIGLPDVSSEGIPLEITALYQTGNIHLRKGRRAEAAGAFFELFQGLVDARWPLTKGQYESFRKTAEDRLRAASGELEASLRGDWEGRLASLKKIEAERLAKTGVLKEVGERLVPRLRLEARGRDADAGRFLRIAEPTDAGLLLASFSPLDAKTTLGLLLDPRVLAAGLLPPGSGEPGPEEDWSVAIVDGSGETVAGRESVSPETGAKSGDPRPVFTSAFTGSFPPWRIVIRRSGAGAAERQFRLRRTVYVLALAAAVAALFFGGFLAIRSTAKELKLAKLKSDFTATVSHEFRTPLMSIRYMAELLQRGRVRDGARRRQYYETITGESERLGRLVENLLDFSKIEAGVKEYRLEDTDAAALAAEVAGRFRQQAAFKDFVMKTEIADGLPRLRADRDALGRAVLNLLDNAVKYSGPNPRVTLRVWSGADAVNFEVEDQGIGIAKSEQKKIFEKFYRSERAQQSSVKGSGIGLPLVEHVVRAHGGEVFLESEPGKGTRVTIRLPLGPPDPGQEGGHG
jgi:signal transduction histidine kinase/tetratricopeptide (TPR) repeat protein